MLPYIIADDKHLLIHFNPCKGLVLILRCNENSPAVIAWASTANSNIQDQTSRCHQMMKINLQVPRDLWECQDRSVVWDE